MLRSKLFCTGAAVLAGALLFAAPASATVQFTVTGLDALRSVDDINASGQVVGEAYTAGRDHAFLHDGATAHDLGTLGGSRSWAGGVNDAGQVTGYSWLSGDPASGFSIISRGFVSSGGVMTAIGTLGGADSRGEAINNLGQVTGMADTTQHYVNGNEVGHAFIYSNGQMTDLGSLGGSSVGYDINDSGQVTGASSHDVNSAGDYTHAFLYSGGTMTSLGTLAGQFGYSAGYAINAAGQVTGVSGALDGRNHAFLYSGGVMIDLGSLGGYTTSGQAINSAGHVVGYGSINDYVTHAFLYRDGAMIDLNSLIDPAGGWQLQYAFGINDAGQIAGYGYQTGVGQRAFVLNPYVAPPPLPGTTAVPEPGAWALMILGFGGTGAALRRRRMALA